jgi:hypothetical protein
MISPHKIKMKKKDKKLLKCAAILYHSNLLSFKEFEHIKSHIENGTARSLD